MWNSYITLFYLLCLTLMEPNDKAMQYFCSHKVEENLAFSLLYKLPRAG